jgi:hypothetical protein
VHLAQRLGLLSEEAIPLVPNTEDPVRPPLRRVA